MNIVYTAVRLPSFVKPWALRRVETLREPVGMGITFLPSLDEASEIRESDPHRVTDVFGVNM